jgi:hypothetical protein
MTLIELYNLGNYILRDDVRGMSCTPEQFELLVNTNQIRYFQELYRNYERTQEMTDSLRIFKEVIDQDDITVISSAYFVLPSDYFHFSTMSYIGSGGEYYPFDMVTKDQAIMRRASTLTAPSTTYPICYEFNGNMYLYPYSSTLDWQMTYLRYPDDVDFTYNVNDDDELEYYGESTSVSVTDGAELEWNEDDQMKILEYVLRDLGVTMNEVGIRQYAQLMRNES